MLDVNEILKDLAHHNEQSEPNYCVPACACIVLSRLGRPMRQDEVCADWHGSGVGYQLKDAVPVLGGRYRELDPDDPGNYDWIELRLQGSHWIVASVFAEEIAKVVQTMSPLPGSQFGDIWHGKLGAHHAVVLTRAIDQRFYYLDPFYPASVHPFSMSRKELIKAFTGYLIEVTVG